jgi:glutamyl-tRNA synthetase
VRFAPSPTGSIHIGGIRTALFNWLFARHHNGAFILRIEDTDQKRFVEGAIELITQGLRWLGLNWDEGPEADDEYGPYVQSERTELYREWAEWLVENGKAYRCYCTPERLERVREIAAKAGRRLQGYDRHCRNLSPEEQQRLHEERGGEHVIRFKMPLDGQTVVHDLIRGDITFDNKELNDLVLLKSDGFPTYHLANVVDDHFMKISHILRADEWISSAPIHWQLYNAFGWEMPRIAHLPVILNPNGKGKLSKRHSGFTEDGQRVPVLLHEFREDGYLPQAIVNFLTNTGWSFGEDREIFTVEETIERFDLERINPAGGAFPIQKLEWLNGHYIREMSVEELAKAIRPFIEEAGYEVNIEKLLAITPHIQERMKTLSEAPEITAFLWIVEDEFEPAPAEDLVPKKLDASKTKELLEAVYDTLDSLPNFKWENQEEALRALAKEHGVKAGQLFNPIRVATTAQKIAPPLFQSMEVLGREESLRRIKLAIERLAALLETEPSN